MTLLQAAENALTALQELHNETPLKCYGPDHCPAARALADLEKAIAQARIDLPQKAKVELVKVDPSHPMAHAIPRCPKCGNPRAATTLCK